MSKLQDMLDAKAAFCTHPPADYTTEDLKKSKLPQKQVALITCKNVTDTVERIRLNPLIPADVYVHGLIFHPRSGKVDVVVDGYK